MKAISLLNPWALLCAYGLKFNETRSKNIIGKHRGELAIHASGRMDDDCIESIHRIPIAKEFKRIFVDDSIQSIIENDIEPTNGHIVAICEVFDVVGSEVELERLTEIMKTGMAANEKMGNPEAIAASLEYCFGNYLPGRQILKFKNMKRLRSPVLHRGALGCWTVSAEAEAKIREQL